ncbi:MAG TPA: DNA polymerase III subunit alpha [Candidatus Acidoferrales bacterium]|nr:DNA polymerase III subunit alpha [Candidatus Acidoferrales bacterium]
MFVHLHCHSHYSFLRAVPSPRELVARAAEQKMPAVALTDTNGLYAAIPFYLAAREAGVKPILGTVLDIESGTARRETPPSLPVGSAPGRQRPQEDSAKAAGSSETLLLLAADRAGYRNLCRLVTARQLEERPVLLETLHAHRAGVIALYAPGNALTSAIEPIARLKEIYGHALYLEVHHLSPGDARALRGASHLSSELGVPLVATNNVHFIRPGEHLHHRVLNAIRVGSLLTQVAPPEITSAEAWFKSTEEMRRVFPDHPEALRATLEIAQRVNLELELGKLIFPEFPLPEGETPFSYLRKLCFEGARQRYQPFGPEVLRRLTHELEVIHRRNLAPYFLLVWDIVEEARRRGIPAVARGSAASSLVTYCLGISRVCPLRWGLYFERFLNEQRGDCPDLDLDICGARRDELLEYVYKRWGTEHVAMIASFVTMHARLAVREVAKVFGLSPGEVNHFTRRLPHRPVREILEAIRTLPECRVLPAEEEPWKTILAVALGLDDFPRHLGIHPCGTVIAAKPLTELVPLEVATKGIVVTQYDMNAIEALGLIKMDLLGQRGLTTMSLALANIEQTTGKRVDFDAIPEEDPATCEMISQGRTMGIFQIESPGMRGLLRALQARTLDAISLALALIRPGASEYGAKETFLKRLRKQEPVRYSDPRLAAILGETLGVCVYQEQVMQIAQAVGSMSLAEADLVRRTTAKFADQRERERLRAKFLKAATQMGLAGKKLDETWLMVEKFAGFGFSKAHAATYADLSYRIAYLKVHYPAEFLAAMCSSGAGFYHVSAYVEEAKRWGIEVRLPSVNRSRLEYTAELPTENGTALLAAPSARHSIRIGLLQVKGLRLETIENIVRARERNGPYLSLENFLRRVPVERDEIEALIKCGAFDEVGEGSRTRPAQLWQLHLIRSGPLRAAPALEAETLFPEALLPIRPAAIATAAADYTREQRLAYEQELLEVSVSGHPLDLVERNGEAWSSELARLCGRRVTLLGWVVTFRHVGTKDYRNMMFVTLEDQRGLYEVVLFPETYERCGSVVFQTRLLRVTGRVEPDGQIHCEKLEAIRRK